MKTKEINSNNIKNLNKVQNSPLNKEEPSQNNLEKINDELDEVESKLKDTYKQLIERGMDLEEMSKDAEEIKKGTEKFCMEATKTKQELERRSKIRNIGVVLAGAITIFFMLPYIIAAAAGILALAVGMICYIIPLKFLAGTACGIGGMYIKNKIVAMRHDSAHNKDRKQLTVVEKLLRDNRVSNQNYRTIPEPLISQRNYGIAESLVMKSDTAWYLITKACRARDYLLHKCREIFRQKDKNKNIFK